MLPESNVGNTPTTNVSRPAQTRAVSSAKACCVGVGQCTRLNLVSKSSYDARSSFSKTDMEGENYRSSIGLELCSFRKFSHAQKQTQQTNKQRRRQARQRTLTARPSHVSRLYNMILCIRAPANPCVHVKVHSIKILKTVCPEKASGVHNVSTLFDSGMLRERLDSFLNSCHKFVVQTPQTTPQLPPRTFFHPTSPHTPRSVKHHSCAPLADQYHSMTKIQSLSSSTK